jgi:hypothetical protein
MTTIQNLVSLFAFFSRDNYRDDLLSPDPVNFYQANNNRSDKNVPIKSDYEEYITSFCSAGGGLRSILPKK